MDRNRSDVDPAVLAIVTDGQRKRTRGKKTKRRRPREYERVQVNLRLAPETKNILKLLAHHEGTSPAGVVDLLVAVGLRAYLENKVHFDQHTEPSRSPRQDWVVRVVDLGALERELEDFLR